MWKRRLSIGLGIMGAAAALLNPLVNESTSSGSQKADGYVVVDAVIGGLVWFLIGLGIGALIDRSKGKRVSAAPVPPIGASASVSPSAAGWFADPFGRFQTRYFDGQAWTPHVSTNGRQFEDEPTP